MDTLVTTRFVAVLALLLAGVVPANAQPWDCSRPGDLPQQGMNHCSEQSWRAADEELNFYWPYARTAMKNIDAHLPEEAPSAATTLLEAQRTWIEFRDLACEADAAPFWGGSMQPTIYYGCLERLTRQRTEDLRALAEQGLP